MNHRSITLALANANGNEALSVICFGVDDGVGGSHAHDDGRSGDGGCDQGDRDDCVGFDGGYGDARGALCPSPFAFPSEEEVSCIRRQD